MTDPDYSYQAAAVDSILDALESHDRALLQLATGGGKTRIATMLAERLPKPLMFMAESLEVVHQSVQAFRDAGLETDVLDSTTKTYRGHRLMMSPVTVAAQRTAWSRVSKDHDLGDFEAIIVDEAHHTRARTYVEILEAFPRAKIIGLTATPCRGDGKGLGDIFQTMIQGGDFGAAAPDLVERGVLVPCPAHRCYSWPISLKGVRTNMGDYSMGGEKGAAKKMDDPKLIGDIVAHWHSLAKDRKTIAFCSSVGHAENLAESFQLWNITADCIHAETDRDERREKIDRFRAGEISVLTNFGIFTEGFDVPDVACIIMARPTKQLGLWTQMVGRGLRQSEGKEDLMLLDHTGMVMKHGLPGTHIEWELTEDNRAATKPKDSLKGLCPECSAILLDPFNCAACGWIKPAPKEKPAGLFRDYDGQDHDQSIGLVKVSDQMLNNAIQFAESRREERSEYEKLKRFARKRGFKPGWVAHAFKKKFGDWPPRAWDLPSPKKVTPEQFLTAAQEVAKSKGYKSGWANFQYKEVYGCWP